VVERRDMMKRKMGLVKEHEGWRMMKKRNVSGG
jgi:hypothetical protein